ncbi:MAG: biopolymer transporter ExbD [Candidatus Manganitrophus sp.]|nr:MAG: biopolymer transporter ExbD [Candidatus Manganitrophus sp.]
MRQQVTRGEQPTVELRADGDLAYQHVVRLMALVQNTGITKISFVTEPGKVEETPAE